MTDCYSEPDVHTPAFGVLKTQRRTGVVISRIETDPDETGFKDWAFVILSQGRLCWIPLESLNTLSEVTT